ncbi:hypothetical protein [Nostoc sp.]|uniref:hypothetical protein n=1 Tax=Nostoc sp. TaxID=1180 RepID=UPI002FFA5D30
MADLDDDEKWLARKYFPLLIAESESSPEDALEHVAEVATIFTNTAMRRILHNCTPQVRADLLMIILRCLPTEVYSDLSQVSVVERRIIWTKRQILCQQSKFFYIACSSDFYSFIS